MKEIILRKLLAGGTAVGSGTTVVDDVGPIALHGDPITNAIFVITANASSTTGIVRIESSNSTSYTGTWATEAVVTCATANVQQTVHIVGELIAVRARISQTANGSGISVEMKAS